MPITKESTQERDQFGITTRIFAGICHNCGICPYAAEAQALFLISSCVGIVDGVQLGRLIQRSMVESRFHDSFVQRDATSQVGLSSETYILFKRIKVLWHQ